MSEDIIPKLPSRQKDSHKGDYGSLLLIGGSRGMSGAIGLAGLAALRSGAGLVSVAVPDPILDTVAGLHPCLMTIPLPHDSVGRLDRAALETLLNLGEKATCVALGPGLGRSAALDFMVLRLFQSIRCPMIVDADGLNALAANMPATFHAAGPRILTPHPGEFERLSNVSRADREQQISAAIAFARSGNLVLVLKGSETVITDGSTIIVNHTGNPKMAVGGSGDCLTGIIAAMVCQGLPPLKAAHLGTALHGMAGDIAAERLACPSILATDLIDDLPEAFCRIARDPR